MRCDATCRFDVNDPEVRCQLDAEPPGTLRRHEHLNRELGYEIRWRDEPKPGEGEDE